MGIYSGVIGRYHLQDGNRADAVSHGNNPTSKALDKDVVTHGTLAGGNSALTL